MTGPGVSDHDMPSFRRSGRRDESALTDESLAALLAGTQDAPPELRPAMDVLAALQAGPARDELADEAAALAEFRINAARPGPGSRRHRLVGLPSLSAKVAAATAVVAVAIGGVATAAVTGVLPTPVQHALHDVLPSIPARDGARPPAKPTRRNGHRSDPAARCGTCQARHHSSTSDRTRPRRQPHCTPVSWWTHPRPRWTPTVRPVPARSPGWRLAWEPTLCGARWHLRHRSGWPHFPRQFTRPTRHHGGMPTPHPSHQPAPRPSRHPAPRPSQPAPRHSSQPARRHHVSRT
jgi:hypothetical protein